MGFLPTGTKVETGGGSYFKPLVGTNKVRILQDAEVGFEYWTSDKKPVRLRERPLETPFDIGTDQQGRTNKIKPFWAVAVWDYADNQAKVWGITQTSIMNAILSLSDNEDWGHPKDYDITITRKGEGLKTEYSVTPSPKKDIPKGAVEALKAEPINLAIQFEAARQPAMAGGSPATMSAADLDAIEF